MGFSKETTTSSTIPRYTTQNISGEDSILEATALLFRDGDTSASNLVSISNPTPAVRTTATSQFTWRQQPTETSVIPSRKEPMISTIPIQTRPITPQQPRTDQNVLRPSRFSVSPNFTQIQQTPTSAVSLGRRQQQLEQLGAKPKGVTTTSPYHLVNLENSDPTRKDETEYYDVMNSETEFTKDAEYLIRQIG